MNTVNNNVTLTEEKPSQFSEAPQYENGNIKNFELDKKDLIFTAVFTLLGICGVAFGLWGGFRLGFTISFITLFAVMTAYLINKNTKIKPFAVFCSLAAVAGTFVFSLGSAFSVKLWLCVLIFVCSAVWFDSLVCTREEKGDLGLIKNVIYTAVGEPIGNSFRAVSSVFAGGKGKRKGFGKLLAGAVLALPVLLFIVPLLISSDAAFEGLVSHIAGDIGTLIAKLILGVAAAVLIVSYCFTRKKDDIIPLRESGFCGTDPMYAVSFLSVISVCYLVYLFSQLAYFFAAFSGFLPKDYTFTLSGYARRGFFEMSIIAGINFVIILGTVLISKKKNNKPHTAIRVLGTFIGLFTLVIIATALSKMFLYIKNYGMTVLRIITSSFMVFLAVVFIAVIIRCYSSRVRVIRTALVTAVAVLLVLGFGNVKSFVAAYNYNAYKSGALEEIDVQTVYELGEEGVPYLVKLSCEKDTVVSDRAKNLLIDTFTDMYEYESEYKYDESTSLNRHVYTFKEHKYKGFEEWSYSRGVAYAYLDKILEKNPDFGNYQRQY